MERLHQPGEIINERYRILNTLGQGGVAITYEALDLQIDQRVALKALSLRRMGDWKKIELFEREARILSQLSHPAIPQYLEANVALSVLQGQQAVSNYSARPRRPKNSSI